jgi:hypothetical protein
MAAIIGVPPRVIGRWERNLDEPDIHRQRQLRDLSSRGGKALSWTLRAAVTACPLPRALSRLPNLRLQALSRPAIEKRPSITEWLGRELAPIADGVLAQMLDNRPLQASIAKGEIFCVMTSARSVLRTAEEVRIGAYRTAISYFFDDGALYSDAISVPAPPDIESGYRIIAMDEIC